MFEAEKAVFKICVGALGFKVFDIKRKEGRGAIGTCL